MKKFICIWQQPVYKDSVEVVDQNFFAHMNGFDKTDIDQIDNLEVSEKTILNDLQGYPSVIVVRVHDEFNIEE